MRFGQTQDAETGPKALLRMGSFAQDHVHEYRGVGAYLPGLPPDVNPGDKLATESVG